MPADQTLRKAAFIDRDGVLDDLVDRGPEFRLSNGKPCRWTAPFVLEELHLKPRVHEALELIGAKGYLRVLVTNQPDVATGNMQQAAFDLIMTRFHALPLDDIYACMHHPKEKCPCRKPAPGMLLSARDKHGIDMARSYMIGDMETDVQAGRAAGVRTVLVGPSSDAETAAHHRVLDLMEAALLLP